jgi:prepilin-type N-terminal cleavage/methylation domain-containing protein
MITSTKNPRSRNHAQAGFTLIEILITATILLISVGALIASQRTAIFSTGKVQKQQDMGNLLNQRLSYFRRMIKTQIGASNFLRMYATSSGSIGNFNPILDTDPNQNFSQAFSDGTTTIANPENININDHTYGVNYQITLKMINYDSGSGTFQMTDLSFPNGSVTLSQVGLIVVTANLSNVTGPSTESYGEVDVSVP